MQRIIIVFLIILLSPHFAFSAITFKQLNQGLKDFDILSLAISDLNPNLVYVGSNRAIYRTENGGKTWQVALSLRGSNRGVNFLAFNQKNSNIIYAATENGLFKLKDANSNIWEKLFSGIGELEKRCTYVLADADIIFLGTRSGLFISTDSGKNWRKASGELGRLHITSVDINEMRVFVTASNKLFASLDSGKNWKRAFSLGLRDDVENDISSLESEDSSGTNDTEITRVFIDNNKIYLAAKIGLFVSLDNGVSFSQVYSTGLTGAVISHIVSNAGNLYVSTQKGVFALTKDKQVWQSLYAGLVSYDIRFIAFDSLNRLWLATDKGIFRSKDPYFYKTQPAIDKNLASSRLDNWGLYFKDEPTVAEIQAQAIKYAEVIDPQKIRNLRRGARLKALLPDIDLDYDRTINYDSGSDNHYIGPQDWSLGLSWDLGDLVWSEQQRLIDSQVRLMVGLRDDILTEVTRLYFERRRLQAELLIFPPEDQKVKLEKELRLQELTASIDALTDGYLSKQSRLQ